MKKDLQVGDEVVAICMGSVLNRFVVDSISRMGDVRYKDSEGNPSTLLTNHWTNKNGQVGVIYPHKNISHINCVEYYYVTDEMKERYENISVGSFAKEVTDANIVRITKRATSLLRKFICHSS